MPLYVNIPRDLSRVKNKVLFNLTLRQLICFGIAAVFGIPSFFFLKSISNNTLATLGMILVMLPMFFMGMFERDGMPCEVIAGNYIRAMFLRPKQRPYRTDNYYMLLMRQEELEKEVERIVHSYEEKP